eukprot:6070066-Pyramimonas_sp.AAC.2
MRELARERRIREISLGAAMQLELPRRQIALRARASPGGGGLYGPEGLVVYRRPAAANGDSGGWNGARPALATRS